MASQRPRSQQLDILVQLHLLIAQSLPLLPTLYHLRQTNHYFHTLLPPPTHTELLAAETSPFAIAHNLYACRYCLRLRPGHTFADRMLRHGRGRYGRKQGNRFCLECGVKPREGGSEARYALGDLADNLDVFELDVSVQTEEKVDESDSLKVSIEIS
ncbi:hypothetical protein BO70DRAFT_393082 [Aspergillus heteromorphus CBS 117.55]|uniref:F-box domain-containing protein n=1 Tax=Aspergillus heteromorphus CBS 117.55 TaxID=1448321 RepID=A0A317WU53_9EURO|nr:uncharacterized protein BO70DRAFT_393082 [Aspergillus heteromorphus CBS 117.55]PWY89886.1 hypothetical protein BO70DRAFT_393082 [Aspergillus heteromorphus CBS 117.55]